MHPPDRMHGVGTLGEGLPNAHQEAGGERDGQAAGIGQGAHPDDRVLVRAAVVGLALDLEEPPRRGFQHHAHRRRHRLEPGKLGPAHHAGIEVRQQAGLLQHPDGHCPQVRQCRVVAAFVKPLPSLRPPRLRPIAEGEQCFLATEFGATGGEGDDLVGLEIHAPTASPQLARRGNECAVVAGIAAEMGEGNEHLARVGDGRPTRRTPLTGALESGIADPCRARTQVREVVAAGSHREGGLVDVECHSVAGPSQHPPQRRRAGHRDRHTSRAIDMAPTVVPAGGVPADGGRSGARAPAAM